jgi:hypothetical protein
MCVLVVLRLYQFIFLLGFCILLRVLYQGYQENHPSQQLFKAFIVFVFWPLHVSSFTGHHQVEHTI